MANSPKCSMVNFLIQGNREMHMGRGDIMLNGA